ncbi:response regulator [bacterium]|nr:response regulator [bacterium]
MNKLEKKKGLLGLIPELICELENSSEMESRNIQELNSLLLKKLETLIKVLQRMSLNLHEDGTNLVSSKNQLKIVKIFYTVLKILLSESEFGMTSKLAPSPTEKIDTSNRHHGPDKSHPSRESDQATSESSKQYLPSGEIESNESLHEPVIVICDDEVIILETYQAIIEACFDNVHVHTCDNPIQAINLIENKHPDLLITDFQMPQMDGIELVEEVVKLDDKLKVVMVSANVGGVLEERALGAGVDKIIFKPFTYDCIIDIVEMYTSVGKPGGHHG